VSQLKLETGESAYQESHRQTRPANGASSRPPATPPPSPPAAAAGARRRAWPRGRAGRTPSPCPPGTTTGSLAQRRTLEWNFGVEDMKERHVQYQSADCSVCLCIDAAANGFQSCRWSGLLSAHLHEEWPLGKLLCPSLITLATPSHRTPPVMLSYFCNGSSESLIFSARCGDNQ